MFLTVPCGIITSVDLAIHGGGGQTPLLTSVRLVQRAGNYELVTDKICLSFVYQY